MKIPNVPGYYSTLSLSLDKILENIGLTEQSRKQWGEFAASREILGTIANLSANRELSADVSQPYFSVYIFGSSAEGTKTVGLHSDLDYVLCMDALQIFQSKSDISNDLVCSFLMVRDRHTKPGYTKLQYVVNGELQTVSNVPEELIQAVSSSPKGIDDTDFDCNGRVVRCTNPKQFLNDSSIHGPAESTEGTGRNTDCDHVQALRVHEWPKDANVWLQRKRKYNWPSLDMIQHMKTLGFFLVSVGHPDSKERDIEWRISLSLQERYLMASLNPTQFKCYVLLKLVKKDVINKLMGEESLSSYHLKTCIFYMLENTPSELWIPENLLACMVGCLEYILSWVRRGVCPNYFIPSENLFERRIHGHVKDKLKIALEQLLASDCNYLLGIHSDNIAQHFNEWCSSEVVNMRHTTYIEAGIIRVHLCSIGAVFHARHDILIDCSSNDSADVVKQIFQVVSDIIHMDTITEHTVDEVRKASNMLLPYIELSLLSNLVAEAYKKEDTETDRTAACEKILMSDKWKELGAMSDCYSLKLKQATFLFMLGQYDVSLALLKTATENNIARTRISFCYCRDMPVTHPSELYAIVHEHDISCQDFLCSYIAPCVVYLQSEIHIVPNALAYEMIRSFGMPVDSKDDYDDCWFDWAVIDSKMLLYFLLFLNHMKLGLLTQAKTDIDHMQLVYSNDGNLGHKETALNILSWCYKQLGMHGSALECLRQSITKQQTHNAAAWHLAFLIHDLMTQLPTCSAP